MARYVHLTDEKNVNAILKNGVKTSKIHYEKPINAVFCMPIIDDFYATHQWLREMKRRRSGGEIIAVYFKIPDSETVYCGKYTEKPQSVEAREAREIFMNLEDKMGFQVVIKRKILKNEISKIKRLPQITGWRYFPKSHDKKPCFCPACLSKGSFNSSAMKKQELEKLYKRLRGTNDADTIGLIFGDMEYLITDEKISEKNEAVVKNFLTSDNETILCAAIWHLNYLFSRKAANIENYKAYLIETIYAKKSAKAAIVSLQALTDAYGYDYVDTIDASRCLDETIKELDWYKENGGDERLD
jgi:hypothetical protein